MSIFNSSSVLRFGIRDYIVFLMTYLRIPIPTLILGFIYTERLLLKLSKIWLKAGLKWPYLLTDKNSHKIILAAVIVAYKYSIDRFIGLKQISNFTGLSIKDLEILESEFLTFLNFKLYVSKEEFEMYMLAFQNFYEVLDARKKR